MFECRDDLFLFIYCSIVLMNSTTGDSLYIQVNLVSNFQRSIKILVETPVENNNMILSGESSCLLSCLLMDSAEFSFLSKLHLERANVRLSCYSLCQGSKSIKNDVLLFWSFFCTFFTLSANENQLKVSHYFISHLFTSNNDLNGE